MSMEVWSMGMEVPDPRQVYNYLVNILTKVFVVIFDLQCSAIRRLIYAQNICSTSAVHALMNVTIRMQYAPVAT